MYIFGPVTSRRFGISLGVDLSPNSKQCNFDCLYCELKKAPPVDKMIEVAPLEGILNELKSSLQINSHVDFITLTANGEPTLYPHLKELVQQIQALHVEPKILILSNGSTITDKSVQEALISIDVVKLSLDCATSKSFKKLDRPHKSLHVEDIVSSMVEFSAVYNGELVLEILVVEGVNDNEEEFRALNEAIAKINPKRVDVGTIARPPAYGVKGVSKERLYELSMLLEGVCVSVPWEPRYKSINDFSKEQILELLQKRPQSVEDVEKSFSDSAKANLKELLNMGKIELKNVAGVEFYKKVEKNSKKP